MHLGSAESWKYLLRSVAHYWAPTYQCCPACGGSVRVPVSRKAVLTRLWRCTSCQLLFRTPIDPPMRGADYYQQDYQSSGLTTTLPDPTAVAALRASNFRGSQKDFSSYLAVLPVLGLQTGARVLDYGASWGYATLQLCNAGYQAIGYELSRARARFGSEQLGVDIQSELAALPSGLDCIFSSHVIEHLPDPGQLFALAQRLLRPGGLFVAFTPNGSLAYRARAPHSYDRHWGRDHPVYLDEHYCSQQLAGTPLLLASRPYRDWRDGSALADWDGRTERRLDLSQPELLIAFRTPTAPPGA